MNETQHALETSATHLLDLVQNLEPAELTRQAYPTKWTIADVLSHVGSGAVIMRRRIEAEVDHEAVPDGFNQSAWDEWNAKDSPAKAAHAMVADRQLLDLVAALTDEQRSESTLQDEATALVIDNLEVIGRFGGKPDGTETSKVESLRKVFRGI